MNELVASGPESSTAAPPALEIAGLWKSFVDLHVLRGVDLTVAEHEVVCLIGSSGCGKSTLLRCVNLLEPIDAGRILVKGKEITASGVDVNRMRRRIGRRLPAERSSIRWPSRITWPAVMSNSRRIARPTVDLPQPDSPTSDSVSPRAIWKDTPSTA